MWIAITAVYVNCSKLCQPGIYHTDILRTKYTDVGVQSVPTRGLV